MQLVGLFFVFICLHEVRNPVAVPGQAKSAQAQVSQTTVGTQTTAAATPFVKLSKMEKKAAKTTQKVAKKQEKSQAKLQLYKQACPPPPPCSCGPAATDVKSAPSVASVPSQDKSQDEPAEETRPCNRTMQLNYGKTRNNIIEHEIYLYIGDSYVPFSS